MLKILAGIAVYLFAMGLLARACGMNREGDKIAEEEIAKMK